MRYIKGFSHEIFKKDQSPVVSEFCSYPSDKQFSSHCAFIGQLKGSATGGLFFEVWINPKPPCYGCIEICDIYNILVRMFSVRSSGSINLTGFYTSSCHEAGKTIGVMISSSVGIHIWLSAEFCRHNHERRIQQPLLAQMAKQ